MKNQSMLSMSYLRFAFSNLPHLPRSIFEWIAPIILIFLLLIAVRACTSYLNNDVIIESKTPEPASGPIRILSLAISPNPVTIGESASLIDGVCNDSKDPITVAVYLGVQNVGGSALTARTIDLLRHEDGSPVRDTEESRSRIVINPGCLYSQPIPIPMFPSTIPPGLWILRLHMVINADIPEISITSEPFQVLPASGAR